MSPVIATTLDGHELYVNIFTLVRDACLKIVTFEPPSLTPLFRPLAAFFGISFVVPAAADRILSFPPTSHAPVVPGGRGRSDVLANADRSPPVAAFASPPRGGICGALLCHCANHSLASLSAHPRLRSSERPSGSRRPRSAERTGRRYLPGPESRLMVPSVPVATATVSVSIYVVAQAALLAETPVHHCALSAAPPALRAAAYVLAG